MNGKTLTAEQCSKLSLYILMTTHRIYCSSCSAADCDDCRRPERDSPLWWLGLPAAEAEK